MRVSVPKDSTGRLSDAWRHCVGTGRFELALRRVHHAFTYVDQVVDAYLDLGVKPLLELGFMPAELASGDQTVFWWNGNVTPPRSWPEWADLVLDLQRQVRGGALRVVGGSVDLDLVLDRHEVTLVEITPVTDETPPWWDENRLLGTGKEEG